jgi:hypothetical protein
MCPPFTPPEPGGLQQQLQPDDGLVPCGTFTNSTDCIQRCCRETGVCFSSSCVTTFGFANDAQANCENKCLDLVQCVAFVPTCEDPHCLGFIHCINGPTDCDGKFEGEYCLYDGKSKNFKACNPNEPPPSSTGPEGFIVGDPAFVGLRGQQYQVHGVAGEVYNIVSDSQMQYNSRFVFLNQGDCPVVGGKKQKGCFAHPGSYLGEIGIKTSAGDKILLSSGPAADGFLTVSVNDKPLELGELVYLSDSLGSVARNHTHLSAVQVGRWQFDFENSDRFINQRVRVENPNSLRSHGLLGQTWRKQTYKSTVKHVQGQVDDYVIRGSDLFGDDFVFNAFN